MAGIVTRNPATGKELPDTVPPTSEAEAREAIIAARKAQQAWGARTFQQRAGYVYRTKKFLAENADRAARIISESTGKTRQDALATEVLPCVMACEWYASETKKVLAPTSLPSGNLLFANKTNYLEYSPVGVVGIISPWNYPFSIPFGEVIMGLMAGNTIVLKVASCVPLVGQLIDECMKAGGFPDGVFTHIVTPGAATSRIMLEGGVNKIFFTGSVGVGKQLMRDAAATLTPLSLELGGKDAAVVFEDADLERATNCIAWAGYQNAGQSCGGVERVYVHRKVFMKFVQMLSDKTKALRHGPDTEALGSIDVGSLTTKGQLQTVASQVDDAVARGARIVAQSRPVGDCSGGFFFPATLMVDVQSDMRLMTEETFGPIIPVMPFSTEDEARLLANGNSMALTASVFTRDSGKARKFARTLDGGVVTVNDHLYTHGMAEAPWGGWKDSGLGRTHGVMGLKEMSNVRCINEDWLPGAGSMAKRNMWWYPFSERSYATLQSAVSFVAPTGLCGSISALMRISKFALGFMFSAWKPAAAETEPKE